MGSPIPIINMQGCYPVGTVVALDDGSLGLVRRSRGEREPNRPEILLLEADEDGHYQKGSAVRLWDRDSKTGAYLRNVVKSFHPSVFGIQPANMLIDEVMESASANAVTAPSH